MMSKYTHKLVNGNKVSLSAEEVAELEAIELEWEAQAVDRLRADIREKRKPLLEASDFRVMPDYKGTDAEAWKSYRQALRDLPNQDLSGLTPKTLVWPTPPK